MKLLNFYHVSILKKYKKKHIRFLQKYQQKKILNNIIYGNFALKTQEESYLTPRQIEAARRIFSKKIKKNFGTIWIRKKQFFSVTEKPFHFRMGKGKGLVKYWVITVYGGDILYEIQLMIPVNKLIKIYICSLLAIAKTKLPIKCIILLTKIIF